MAAPEKEVPKRLAPKLETVRLLFAYSGNRCAQPDCEEPLVDQDGTLVAELCHIEGALPGSARFNPEMTNEERRLPENLLLMCHKHHKRSDKNSVEEMRMIKADHEGQFVEAVLQMIKTESAIVDITTKIAATEPSSLARYGRWVNKGVKDQDSKLTEEELRGTRDEMLMPIFERVCKLPPDTRGVLLIVVERGLRREDDLGLATDELEQVTGEDAETLKPHIRTLERYGVAHLGTDWSDESGDEYWVYTNAHNGWAFWSELREFCKDEGLEVRDFIIDLRFDLLD